MKRIFSLIVVVMVWANMFAQNHQRYVGGDISMLPKYEQYNSTYKDAYEQNIDNLLRWFVTDCGWNTFRVRIFVNPIEQSKGAYDPQICQDLAYVTALGKRIKEVGGYFLLDFHYSDEWVDALHIQAPVAWQGASDAEMAQHVAEHTREVLTALNEAGATPDLVQVGNEIMYGLCGIKVHPYSDNKDNWEGYLGLLQAGCNTVRELCPNAQIIIHTDRPSNSSYNKYYYQKLVDNGVDYDIIGLSYYPFWHGYLPGLVNAVNRLATDFPDKRVHIVETAYNFQWWPTSGVNYDTRDVWECSKKGQYTFVKDLVDALLPLENVDGLSYWFPEEAGNGDKGTVLTGWLNRGFWDENQSTTGHRINRAGQPTGDKTAADVCAPYYMGKFVEEPQGIEILPTPPTATKKIHDGLLLIERNNRLYTVEGKVIIDN